MAECATLSRRERCSLAAIVSQLECPVSFFGAASTSAPPYKADPGHFRHCPFLVAFYDPR
jgi:hypothetical protein